MPALTSWKYTPDVPTCRLENCPQEGDASDVACASVAEKATEVGHILATLIFIAHCFVQDEPCPELVKLTAQLITCGGLL